MIKKRRKTRVKKSKEKLRRNKKVSERKKMV